MIAKEELTEAEKHTKVYRILRALLQLFIKDNVNTKFKIEMVVRCARNYAKNEAQNPLWEWNNEFEVIKSKELAEIYKKYSNTQDPQWQKYNLKKLFNIALTYDNEESQCRRLYYEIFPEEDPVKREVKEAHDELYNEMKDTFEINHFKCNDIFYEIQKSKLISYSRQGFMTKFEDYRLNEKVSFLDIWLKDPDKRVYRGVDFIPPPLIGDNDIFNTWELVKIEPDTEEEEDTDEDLDTSVFYEFFMYLSLKDKDTYEYILKYFSHLIKYPAIKPHVSLFFTGAQGGGKDTLTLILRKLIGYSSVMMESDPENVLGKFNWGRMNKLVVCLQETENIKAYANKIKDLITCQIASIADKGVKKIEITDYTRLIIFSNEENIIKIEPTDRRFVVIKTWNFKADPQPIFFEKLYKAIENKKMISKFRKELNSYEIEQNFSFQSSRPITEIYTDLKEVNTPNVIKWAWDLCINEENINIKSIELCAFFNEWCKRNWTDSRDTNVKAFGLNIKKFFYINNEWKGFDKKRSNLGQTYNINTRELKKFIEQHYNYIGEN